ncbi:MAG TPA: hypothetical protein PLB21_00620 [Actinomycetota bacterium]|nr:hypothetical protein [Actinomycetota bacterium]
MATAEGTEPSDGARPKVTVQPITGADLAEVGAFLHDRFMAEQGADTIPVDVWAANLAGPWDQSSATHGVQLRASSRLVGVYVAYYSPIRPTSVGPTRFCNLADWAVLEEYRAQGLLLVMNLLGQPGLVITDFTARAEVARINRRLGFTEIDAEPYLSVNLPLPSLGRNRLLTRHQDIAAALEGDSLQVFRDHRGISGLHHLVIVAENACHVMFRRRTVPLHRLGGRRLPVACIIHVSDRAAFARSATAVSTHLLLRHRLPLTWSEVHITGIKPALSRPDSLLAAPRMYRGEGLQPDDINYLYSELVFG